MERVATRTSTRPPPCPTSAPCPYRTGTRAFPIRLSTIIRTGNAHDPMRSSTVIRRGADPLPVRCCGPGSCRDKGRGGVDEGAWCLSWLGCDLVAPRSHQDKHQAPTLPHIRPLSLQDPIRLSTFIRGLSEAERSAYQYFVPTADLSAWGVHRRAVGR